MKLLFLFCMAGVITGLGAAGQPTPHRGGSGLFKKLVWYDEFSRSGLPDTTIWRFEKGYLRTKELQYYTEARLQNAEVKDGVLHIIARNDSMKNGADVYPITSASLTTKGKTAWTYGRIEVRAKIPSSRGTWPAIWTLGRNFDSIGWPRCGEIDILEHVGYKSNAVHFNVYTEKYNHEKGTHKGVKVPYKAPYSEFHVYALEWFPDRMDWYMDDKKVFTFRNDKSGTAAWPFDKPQYLIMNLAFGGNWGGQRGVDITSLPQRFLVDYVRIYQ